MLNSKCHCSRIKNTEVFRAAIPNFQRNACSMSYLYKHIGKADDYRNHLKNVLVVLTCFNPTDVGFNIHTFVRLGSYMFILCLGSFSCFALFFPCIPSPTLNSFVDDVKTIFSSVAAASG